jgi:hypothetical protein
MAQFKLASPLNVPLMLLIPEYSTAYGVPSKSYPALSDGILIYGNFRTFGGTEREVNGVYSIENTATVETWYRPDIKSNCRIGVPQTGQIYEILGEPENIGMRNQYMRLKLMKIKGGV